MPVLGCTNVLCACVHPVACVHIAFTACEPEPPGFHAVRVQSALVVLLLWLLLSCCLCDRFAVCPSLCRWAAEGTQLPPWPLPCSLCLMMLFLPLAFAACLCRRATLCTWLPPWPLPCHLCTACVIVLLCVPLSAGGQPRAHGCHPGHCPFPILMLVLPRIFAACLRRWGT